MIKEKIRHLKEIYNAFEADIRTYQEGALCRPGCAFCCTTVGNIDVTTVEGFLIKNRIQTLPKPQRKKLKKTMIENRRKKERNDIARCPFLQKNKTCMIYETRPFTCRKLYSLKPCKDRGPTLHRDVVVMAQKTVLTLQSLDDTGYSGHISNILYLLEQSAFVEEYLSGRFNPAAIMSYGKEHGIIINQMATGA